MQYSSQSSYLRKRV